MSSSPPRTYSDTEGQPLTPGLEVKGEGNRPDGSLNRDRTCGPTTEQLTLHLTFLFILYLEKFKREETDVISLARRTWTGDVKMVDP